MNDDLRRYIDASERLASTQTQVDELTHSEGVETFNRQLSLLKRRLQTDPAMFRDLFIADGMAAVAAEFRAEDLSKGFTTALWQMLLRDDDASRLLMRFIWDLPLRQKRTFVRALDEHLSDRYPMFKGLSLDWPATSVIPPFVRDAESRQHDFDLVTQGFLGYMTQGYTRRAVDLFVWL